MEKQYTNNIMMIRPANFMYNEQTAVTNAFQTNDEGGRASNVNVLALQEFDNFVLKLKEAGVNVIVMHDSLSPIKPDAIFPNNWVSFHGNGTVITYPMATVNRRIERREDILDALGLVFKVNSRYSFESSEEDNQFLEGTGSMILDRENKIVYACLSPRTDIFLLDRFCLLMGYGLVSFYSTDREGKEIYHTNVMMAIADQYAVVCLDSIKDEDKRMEVRDSLEKTGKEVIELTFDQVLHFAGNMLQVEGHPGKRILVMSQQAYDSLTREQIDKINSYNPILAVPIPTIEKYGGGSVRCMMAEVFLPKR
ncbi:MAG TPA: arginine deiminase-related protein [Saprospiraceae bacterium]|nr:MAG: amidinotransferase [Candidatus Parvibacillus calidus]WKZ63045.1 MAG: arginine deiminase-related protein [Saprospiraceae bacterium]HRN34943.1 arginine deiminase-related protein [Saprospiraceae bacterium]